MSNETSIGNKAMVAFLKFMVVVLVIILIAIPVCILLDLIGIL